ncbi:cbb3-type cytochrome c oxidase N-terminal domain-containing protein [Wenyingzhuangia sp. chi5]|uniref:Cbb3-type cytochrome c oxidase N-terminal domain-containing protein n=1 Tax=Wenyingzhuangia gilva TaxID=3057677 RepID=A0ABT8VS63_9FLAO|nr:cbb3-type cytochrome c oxidase N-terminal domain-containing protein [Wenyingzhuangia sp. chi5]MDO3694798.1 cbb3-type cytochrome c oxidase N-terminal domain-containing protein [Wenyingzhuangia sp. chi5]
MSVKKQNKQIIGFVIISVLVGLLLEWMFPSENGYSSLIALKITLYLIFMAAIFSARFVVTKMNNLYLSLSSEEEKKAFYEKKNANKINWSDWKSVLDGLMAAKPVAEESDIILDHDYDGIKELDNNLPPWWIYGFYMTIVFAVSYMVYYEVLDGKDQKQEYLAEVALAKKQIAAYEATQEKVDMSALAEGDNAQGKKLYKRNCAVCHAVDGGGKIGPNLTDNYWILGGSMEDIYNTISEGGRAGKGMIAWKNSFSSQDRQMLAAYVKSLKGTTPAEPKEPQGDLYEEE